MKTKNSLSALLIAGIVVLPACDPAGWFGGKKSSTTEASTPTRAISAQDAIIIFDNDPKVSSAEFENYINMFMQAQPQFQQMLPFGGAEMFNQIAEGIATERLVTEAIKKSGVDQTAEYKEQARQVHEAVDRDLALRAFQNEILKEIQVTDSEAEKFYRENRDKLPTFKRPPFVKSAASAKIQVITATNEKEAQDLAALAKKGDFDTVAKNAKKTAASYDAVTQQTPGLDASVKAKVMTMKSGSIEVVKGMDNKFYVVKVVSLQEPQYANFDTIKDSVKQVIMEDRFTDRYNKKITDLKNQYKVTINKEALDKIVKKFIPEAPEAQEEEMDEEVQSMQPSKAA